MFSLSQRHADCRQECKPYKTGDLTFEANPKTWRFCECRHTSQTRRRHANVHIKEAAESRCHSQQPHQDCSLSKLITLPCTLPAGQRGHSHPRRAHAQSRLHTLDICRRNGQPGEEGKRCHPVRSHTVRPNCGTHEVEGRLFHGKSG